MHSLRLELCDLVRRKSGLHASMPCAKHGRLAYKHPRPSAHFIARISQSRDLMGLIVPAGSQTEYGFVRSKQVRERKR